MVIPAKPRRAQPTLGGTHRPKLKTIAAIQAAKWLVKRRGTRVTPALMVLFYPLAVLSLTVVDGWNAAARQFGGSEIRIAWWFVLFAGACATWLMWLTQRQVVDRSVDDAISEKQASEWAWRSAVIPAAGTLYMEFLLWAHARDWALFTPVMITGYIGCCTLVWTFLYISGHVTSIKLKEQLDKTWMFRTTGTVLDGSRIKRRRRTIHGEEFDLDVSDVSGLPSGLLSQQAKEDIAVRHRIPVERVRIKRGTHAAAMTIQITHSSPWKQDVLHPLHPSYRSGEYGSRSIKHPVVIGIDPTEHAESKRAVTKYLFTNEGAQHVLVVAGTGGGKTNLVNNIVEHVTDCHDAEIVLIDVTKAIDANAWRWACKRVHCGPDALEAAVVELESAKKLIDARSAAKRAAARKSAIFKPTSTDRALIIVLDEADQVLVESPKHLRLRAQAAAKYILSKGRSEGVGIIICAQRGTLDYLGKGDVKANSFTRIVLGVSQTSEMSWALPGWESRGIPDMATFGEGAKGVFVLAEPRDFRTGRACALHDTELIEAIAMDRCRPEHLDDLVRQLHLLAEEIGEEGIPVLTGGRWQNILATTGLPDLPGETRVPAPQDSVTRVQATPSNVIPIYGTQGSSPDDTLDSEPGGGDVDTSVERMQDQARRAVAITGHLATEANRRGPISLTALVTAKRGHRAAALNSGTGAVTGPVEVPQEVRRYALTLAAARGRGFMRSEFEDGLAQIVESMPSSRWVREWLRVMVEDGQLERTGGGRYVRYRIPRMADGDDA